MKLSIKMGTCELEITDQESGTGAITRSQYAPSRIRVVLDGSPSLMDRPWHVQTDRGVTLQSFATESAAHQYAEYLNLHPHSDPAPTVTPPPADAELEQKRKAVIEAAVAYVDGSGDSASQNFKILESRVKALQSHKGAA